MVDNQNPDLLPLTNPDETPRPSPLIKGCVVVFYLIIALLIGSVLAICFGPASGCATTAHAQQPVFGERPPPDAGTCTLIFPVGDLTKVLLQQSNNQVLLDVHEHVLQLRPGDSPLVTCRIYRGIYRPSTPVAKTWKVAEIKFVEMDIFQKLVDEAIGNADNPPNDDAEDPVPAAKKVTKTGPPILPSVPLNPNTPR